MKRIILLLGIFMIASMLFTCAPKAMPAAPVEGKPSEIAAPVTKTGWEAKWDKTMAEARKEGKVVLYGGTTVALLKDHATKLVKEKFGLDLETVVSTGAENRAKIRTERQRGIFSNDVQTSGVSVHYDLKAMGALDPMEPILLLPEVLDTNNWLDGKLPWGDDEKTTFIWGAFPNPPLAINTDMVRPGEIKSYKDLLDPRWKGKILINDPSTSGQAQLVFAGTIYNNMVDADYYRQLVREQGVTISRDLRLQVEWLAKGKFPILLHPSPGTVVKFLEVGAPIAWAPLKEGVILAGAGTGLSVMNKAPHPNAVKIFINWFLSREGQQLIQDVSDKQSQRVDISTDKLRDIRQPGVKYFPDPTNMEKFVLEEYPKYGDLAKEIFAPLLR